MHRSTVLTRLWVYYNSNPSDQKIGSENIFMEGGHRDKLEAETRPPSVEVVTLILKNVIKEGVGVRTHHWTFSWSFPLWQLLGWTVFPTTSQSTLIDICSTQLPKCNSRILGENKIPSTRDGGNCSPTQQGRTGGVRGNPHKRALGGTFPPLGGGLNLVIFFFTQSFANCTHWHQRHFCYLAQGEGLLQHAVGTVGVFFSPPQPQGQELGQLLVSQVCEQIIYWMNNNF